jgi:hypothetical protein
MSCTLQEPAIKFPDEKAPYKKRRKPSAIGIGKSAKTANEGGGYGINVTGK